MSTLSPLSLTERLPKVLLVDDRSANLFALEAALEPLDAEIYTATSGNDALALLLAHTFAVVLLDVQMPGMDGFEIADLMHANESTRYIPIIFVTAISKEDRYRDKGYASGAVDYLLKPIDSKVLLGKVQVFLDLDRQRYLVKIASMKLEQSVRENILILDCTAEGIVGLDREQRVVFANPAARSIFNVGANEDIVGVHISKYVELTDGDWSASPIACALEERDSRTGIEVDLHRSTNAIFPAECSIATVDRRTHADVRIDAVFVFQDITDRKRAHDELIQMARYDQLTGVANRSLFYESVNASVARSSRTNVKLGLLMFDLDRFKEINDNWGHDAGDRLLKLVAKSLASAVRAGDLVARLGGDEFAVLLDDIKDTDNAKLVAHKILETLGRPMELSGHKVVVEASIGISIFDCTQDDLTTHGFIKRADSAMYESKRQGRNTITLYTKSLEASAERYQKIERGLRDALHNGNEFSVFYQPQFFSDTGKLAGIEALVRWHNPVEGNISPAEFIPVAEETGLITEVDDFVFTQAAHQFALWKNIGCVPAGTRLAINVSAVDLRGDHLLQKIQNTVASSILSFSDVEVEVTETAMMEDPDCATCLLTTLSDLGVHVAVDDFGTGYSSLSYLQQFPVTTLKIDRSFVSKINDGRNEDCIVRAVLGLGKELGVRVVAEGVELAEQAMYLRNHGCEVLQGFWLSPPLPADDLTQILMTPVTQERISELTRQYLKLNTNHEYDHEEPARRSA